MEWNLSGVRPALLTARVTAAALTVGATTGAAAIMLIPVYAEAGATPAGLALAVAVPVALLALTVWRIAAESGRAAVVPRRRWLAGLASASIPLVTAAQLVPRGSGSGPGAFTETAGMVLLGVIVGVVPAMAALIAVVPLVLLLRAVRPRTGLLFAQLSMTVVATAGTALCVAAVTSDIPGTGPAVGLAAAISGAAAAVIARPILSGDDTPVTAAVARS
ncbi:hypothetical protein [Catenuloplanes indicus]|uniref:Uncharacterized protein n=1 Tax=Catenuloplanes indicus TaxID=137267 RepID=A0AAE4B3G1_9ACTN|nr:hypothetical protein [Catenuloplanes indicus]MDQ0370083.1 hypothetical protein [Catenuloplanes indicus]